MINVESLLPKRTQHGGRKAKTDFEKLADRLAKEVGEPGRFKYIDPKERKLIWQAQEGMQNELFMLSGLAEQPADEILLGGLRGPGKTDALIAWMAEPIGFAKYNGLILRFSQTALDETIVRCDEIYRQMGGRKCGRPPYWEFPGGARIYTGHLKGDKDYENYRGHEYQRIGIEEATQIGKKSLYAMLFGSNRSTIPGLKPKILLTSNPDGPGNEWIKRHFVNVWAKGKKIPPKQRFIDPVTDRIRVFIPGRRDENKILLKNDPGYYKRLRILAPHLQKAWIEGDWDAPASQFFPEFRPHGPMLNERGEIEPEEARHVIPAMEIPPWCHRWISMDWGYAHHSAVYWGARGPDKRVHVYQEFVVRKMGSDMVGAEIAKRSVNDLEASPDGHMTIYLSHEAFSARDSSHSFAEQIGLGIQSILGPESAFVLTLSRDEKEFEKKDPERALRLMLQRKEELSGRLRITIRRCNPDRKAGWSFIRNMLRWQTMHEMVKPNLDYARELAAGADGYLKANAYMDMFKGQKPEVLPGVLIHDCCPILIQAIPKACANPNKPEDVLEWESDDNSIGDDPLDSFRFLLMAFRDHEDKVPFDVWVQQEVDKHLPITSDINLRIQASNRARQKYERINPGTENIRILPRESMMLRN